MTQRDNILEELRELQSSLVNAPVQNVYHVPGGYFEGLTDQLLNRIKALEAENAAEELNYLSPSLNSISRKMPYSVPAGFFDGLAESVIESVRNNHQTPTEELETLSPLLSGLKKEMPFSVPQGYFEGFSNTVNIETVKPEIKVISITRQKWFRYTAAAVVISFALLSGSLIFKKPITIDPKEKPFAWVEKSLKKVSTDDINEFVELADEEAPLVTNVDVKTANEIKELIKDVSDKEIQDFIEETQTDEQPAANDGMQLN